MDDLAKRIASLSPAKRALFEQKLRQKRTEAAGKSPAQPAQKKLAERIAGLSPTKRALLEQRLERMGMASTPDNRLSIAQVIKRVTTLSPAKQALLEQRLKQKIRASTSPPPDTSTPETLAERVAKLSPAKRTLLERKLKLKAPPVPSPATDDDDQNVVEPSPQAKSSTVTPSLAELEITSSWIDELPLEGLEETPVWLKETPSLDEISQPGPEEDEAIAAGPDELTEADTPEAAQSSHWLESLKSTDEAVPELETQKGVEPGGMLAGISTLLPAEKIAAPATGINGLQAAAQEFFAIATEVPQPATLPAPVSRQEQLVSSLLKAALLTLFVVIIAIPLTPGAQRTVNDNLAPWTEPLGFAEDVLDGQRRQLISQEVGVIDVQPPGTVALVSFDYSTATQGELQPLAEAVVGRLKGQGMKVIAISLEPEGAALAQTTIETVLEERDQIDEYGVDLINLGYLPGRAAAIRALISNPASFANRADFTQRRPLQEWPGWDTIQNLNQIDMVITLADNPVTARWWVEQLELAPPPTSGERFLLAATSAAAEPFLRAYRETNQLDGLLSGINGAAAIEAGRNRFGPGRQMIDSIGIATLIVVILIAVGTVIGWMPAQLPETEEGLSETATSTENETDKPVHR